MKLLVKIEWKYRNEHVEGKTHQECRNPGMDKAAAPKAFALLSHQIIQLECKETPIARKMKVQKIKF